MGSIGGGPAEDGGGGGAGGDSHSETRYLSSPVLLPPSHASVAGKQQLPSGVTLSSAHPPMAAQDVLH